jgi:hypothetical protein
MMTTIKNAKLGQMRLLPWTRHIAFYSSTRRNVSFLNYNGLVAPRMLRSARNNCPIRSLARPTTAGLDRDRAAERPAGCRG